MNKHNLIQQKYWDTVATSLEVSKDDVLSFPALRERERFFEFVGFRKDDAILEIGCGTGKYTLSLLRLGCKVYATDISNKSLEVLRKSAKEEKLNGNLTIEKNSFEKEKDCQKYFNRFDFVICVGVIHHFDPHKRKRIFANIVRSTKIGGEVVAMEPNPLNPLYYFLYFWRTLANIKGKNRWYTEKGFLKTSSFSLKNLFTNAGLQEIEIKRYAWFPSKFGNWLPLVLKLNDMLNKLPILKEMSAFIWIKGKNNKLQ